MKEPIRRIIIDDITNQLKQLNNYGGILNQREIDYNQQKGIIVFDNDDSVIRSKTVDVKHPHSFVKEIEITIIGYRLKTDTINNEKDERLLDDIDADIQEIINKPNLASDIFFIGTKKGLEEIEFYEQLPKIYFTVTLSYLIHYKQSEKKPRS